MRDAKPAAAAPTGCQLVSGNSAVKHIVYLQFDNTHYRRDRPNVASDLEQMPHLLSFLQSNGTLFTNDHTILISHTAGGILSSLTGLYPDRQGQTVSNSYRYFKADGSSASSTSFKYWTDLVDDAAGTADPLPNMVTDGGKTTPAPWVPYTRAGCDFGGVGTANIELENTGTGAFGDMTEVFGSGSPEWNEAKADPHKAQTEFVGIANQNVKLQFQRPTFTVTSCLVPCFILVFGEIAPKHHGRNVCPLMQRRRHPNCNPVL